MKRNTNFEKVSAGKGFYVALSVCILAIAASALGIHYTTNRIRGITDSYTQSTEESPTQNEAPTQEDESAGRKQTGVADERTSAVEPESESTTQPESETATVPTTAAPTTAAPQPVSYILPMGTNIVKDYSHGEMVYSQTMQDWRVHNGIDFAGEEGENVYAVADGKVVKLFVSELYGTCLEIEHDGGVTAYYCGISQDSSVVTGDTVKKGEVIANLGTIPCEQSEGTHLHFETKVDGKFKDPLEVLGRN